ncbi:MAG: glycosyltransferase family 4 protein [Myxococcota bacterium]
MQFHILSFEGPDSYSRVGGLATRVEGLAQTLASLGFETHLWFVGDPDRPGQEVRGCLHLHRWLQWVSRHHANGVYDGEQSKVPEYARTVAPRLVEDWLAPYLASGGHGVVLAEEWQTVDALHHVAWLLERAGLRDRAALLWNANNTFGFDSIDWPRLARAARVTTVSRYMKQRMWTHGVDPLVIPNGLPGDAFEPPDRIAGGVLRERFRDRMVLVKMARWDPDKRWLEAIEAVAAMKRMGLRPLLIARGGWEPYGAEVLTAMRAFGLVRADRAWSGSGPEGLLSALRDLAGADVIHLRSHVDADARRVLLNGADAVLANSAHEPFGLVGLETMAAGGLACTGATGEDYAVPGRNAIVLETGDPGELVGWLDRLRARPAEARSIRRAGRDTARLFDWRDVVERVLLPRAELGLGPASGDGRRRPPLARVAARPALEEAS